MTSLPVRTSLLPAIFLGSLLFLAGAIAVIFMVNTIWPFDAANNLDLARATALGRSDAAVLWDAAITEVISAFLIAVLVGATGLMLPLVAFLNRRFTDNPPRLLLSARQALWFGIWTAACVLLLMNRALGPAVALLLAVVLIIFEFLLQVRARAGAE